MIGTKVILLGVLALAACQKATENEGAMRIRYFVHLNQITQNNETLTTADSVVLDIYKDQDVASQRVTLIPEASSVMFQIDTREGQELLVRARIYIDGVMIGVREDSFVAGDRGVAQNLQQESSHTRTIIPLQVEVSLAPSYDGLNYASCRVLVQTGLQVVDGCRVQAMESREQEVVLELADAQGRTWTETIHLNAQGPVVDSRDAQEYPFRIYGNLLWMTKNMNVEVYGSWCYQNDPLNCEKYGRLYLLYTPQNTPESLRDICPSNWRIPSEEDWQSLEQHLGQNPDELTNESGFAALLGGVASSRGEDFSGEGEQGAWWTSFEISANINSIRRMYSSNGSLIQETLSSSNIAGNALSVRCVREASSQP